MALLMMAMKSDLNDLPKVGTNIGDQNLNGYFAHSQYSADLQLLVYRMVSLDYRDRPSAAEILQHKCLYDGTDDVDRKALFGEQFQATPVAQGNFELLTDAPTDKVNSKKYVDYF